MLDARNLGFRYGGVSVRIPSSFGDKLGELCHGLKDRFLGLGDPNQDLVQKIEEGKARLPQGYVWQVEPNWAKRTDIFGSSYAMAVDLILKSLGALTKHCDFENGLDSLYQTRANQEFMKMVSFNQDNPDVLIFPVSVSRHGSQRDRESVLRTYSGSQFALNTFSVGMLIMTQVELFGSPDEQHLVGVDCLGDLVNSNRSGVPCYVLDRNFINLETYEISMELSSNDFTATGYVL